MRPHRVSSLTGWGLVAGALALGCGDGENRTVTADGPAAPTTCTPTFGDPGLRHIVLPARNDDGVLDLRGWDLSCADLTFASLSGADLRAANLSSAYLQMTRLGGANLEGASLAGANLNGTDLSGANLTAADLTGVFWQNLGGPILAGATLERAILTGADLSNADLSGANLGGADLSGAVVDGADFTWTRAVDLLGCPLTPARPSTDENAITFTACAATGDSFTLIGRGLDLRGADLTGVDGVDVVGARAFDLRGCPELSDYSDYSCLSQPASDGWAVVGPAMSLFGADFTGLDLTGARTLGRPPGYYDQTRRGLIDCPAALAEGQRCIPLAKAYLGFTLFGPGVDLSETDWTDFDLLGADLSGADLTNAVLGFANLTDVRLGDANVDGLAATYLPACPAELPAEWRCVKGASLPGKPGPFVLVGPSAALGTCPGGSYEADLPGAHLEGVNLAGATMNFAHLRQAELSNAELSNTILSGADLSLADLSGADLSGAVLGPREYSEKGCSYNAPGADLTGAVIDGVIWGDTICPDGSNSEEHAGTCEGALERALQ